MAFTVKQLAVGGFDNNFSYLITNGDEAALVDPTGDAEVIRRALTECGNFRPCYILLTHGHLDHMQALGDIITDFPAQIIAHPYHPEAGKKRLRDKEQLPLGDGFIEAVFTPGHSRDSVCYRLSDDSALFTGDVLFVGCIGFCRSREMFTSLTKKILPLADGLRIFSGHDYGEVPSRTLGEEKQYNPFLNCSDLEEFKEKLRELK